MSTSPLSKTRSATSTSRRSRRRNAATPITIPAIPKRRPCGSCASPIYLNDAKATSRACGGGPAAHMGQAGAVLRNTGAGAGVAGKPRARHPGSGADGEAHRLPLHGVPAADFPTFQDQIRELGRVTDTPAALIILAKFEILSGSPANAMRLLPRIRPLTNEAEGEKPSDHAVMIASSRQHIEGMAEFLSGRNQEALGHFREALKLFRKATHKRKIFMPDIQGLLAPLCLLREGDPSLMGELGGLDRGRRARRRDQPQPCRHPGDHGHDRHHQGQRPGSGAHPRRHQQFLPPDAAGGDAGGSGRVHARQPADR